MTSSIRGPRALRGKEGDEVEKGQTKKKKKKKKKDLANRQSAMGGNRNAAAAPLQGTKLAGSVHKERIPGSE